MLRINLRTVPKFFLLLLLIILFTSSFFTAKAKFLNIRTSDSLYISLDLRNPSKIGFEFSLVNKMNLKGEYIPEDGSLKGDIKLWGGEINFKGTLNIPNLKGNLSVTANNIDIAQAMDELDVKGKKPHGKLSFEANLRSIDLFKWKNLLGEGKILISEGDIYQINFLKGLGKFLSIPDFENIVFKRAYSDLFFEGENILFENFQLNATQMNIEGKGKITTVGNIDFLLFPQFSQELIDSSRGIQKYITAFLGKGTFSVSISGTIKNPVYTTNISITPSLDKIEDIIDIFKDIFK